MLEFIDSIWTFIGVIIAMVFFGLIAGFSPTLYATQIGVAAASKRSFSLMISLMVGVLLGIIFLSIFFQFFQLDSLRTFVDSSLKAMYISVVFNIIIGVTFIIGGFWYIHKKPNRIAKDARVNAKSGYWGLITLGFFRTFASISGATATFLASNLLPQSTDYIVEKFILIAFFLAAVIAPFVLLLFIMSRHPEKIKGIFEKLKNKLTKYNYKLVIGVIAILLGSSVIIFNLLRAVTF